MKKFTFIVLIYNEENMLHYCLESIKYQITHYGEKKDFQLILADDGSKDSSCDVADNWVKKNNKLFEDIVRLYGKRNEGTCINLCNALRHMKGEEFYVIAGDDMLAKGNMFVKFELLQQYDIVGNGVLKFKGNRIITQKKEYLNVVLQKIYTESYLRKAVKCGCPILNGAIIKRSLLTESVLARMERFKLLEDRARYYQIFAENEKILYHYDASPILLYRVSENSVSNPKSKHKNVLDIDTEKLYNMAYREAVLTGEKLFLGIQRQMTKWRKKSGVVNKLRYITPYYAKLGILILVNYKELTRCENSLILDYSKENESYMHEIMSNREEVDGNQKD